MVLEELRQTLAKGILEGLKASLAVDVGALVDDLGLDEEAEEELWDELWEADPLIRFETVLDASPMTDTPAAALEITDLGGDQVFLVSPGDRSCDLPMTAYAALPRGDRARAFELAGEVIVWSLREEELPAGGSLSDRLHVAPDFPVAVLRAAFTRAIDEGSVDPAGLEDVLRSLDAWPQDLENLSAAARSRVLAAAYVSATLRPRTGGTGTR